MGISYNPNNQLLLLLLAVVVVVLLLFITTIFWIKHWSESHFDAPVEE